MLSLFLLLTMLVQPGLASRFQTPNTAQKQQKRAAKQDSTATSTARQADELQRILEQANGEPGARMRGLEAFIRKYPHTEAADQIYQLLIQDATALNDDQRVLLYNEKLSELHPDDLGQRIKVLNLLLLNDDAASVARAGRDAAELRRLVGQKAAEAPPAQMSRARWDVDMNRLRALAEMFQGAVALKSAEPTQAVTWFQSSLKLEPNEEAAEKLGDAYVQLKKTAPAVDAYALALALPGDTIVERSVLRAKEGALYAQLHHGSQAGLGDLILAQFDRIAASTAAQERLLHPYAQKTAANGFGDFVLHSLDGREHRLADYRGKVVVVDFWATWCEPCQVEHPIFERLKRQFAGRSDVAFVAVNTADDESKVPSFLASHHWGRDTWLDAGLADYLGIDSLPTTLVISPRGEITTRLAGFDEASFATEIERAIRAAGARSAASGG